jgi:putative CocE/NonD family hydrolase
MPTHAVSEPRYDIVVERNVAIPMRDGSILRADIYRPRAEGRFPVLVERVIYELVERCTPNAEYFVPRGYVFVGQSVRGAFGSEGVLNLFKDDGWGANRDGYDTIEWAGTQPWSNGKVGMVDGSYSGITQYMVAPTRPPHLKALFVREGSIDFHYDGAFRGGAYQLHLHRKWTFETMLSHLQHESAPPGTAAARNRLEQALEELESWNRHRPLKSCPPLEGVADWYFEHLDHPEDGPYWWATNMGLKFNEIDVPIMHLGAWFDIFIDSTLRAFQGIRAHGRTDACRQAQRLVIGPWIHGPDNTDQQQVGQLDFGIEARYHLNTQRLQWYDYWLKGVDNGLMAGPPIRVFLMGDNRWLDLETWPPPGVRYQPLYLRAGQNETGSNKGDLTFQIPEEAESPDSFVDDPDDPIPSLITYPEQGPTDHRPVEARMLTYTSEVLDQDLTIIGPLKAVLYGLSSAPDTNWVVRLSNVWPDGRSISVCDGILQARYRNSPERPELMTPGQIYRFEVDLWSTAQVFKAGHRIRVSIAGSDFPRYAPNLNTGGRFGGGVRGQIAINTIFHDATRPSHVVLPVST